MQITDILSLDCTRCATPGSSKKRILETISHLAHQHLPELAENDILDALVNRERMGSTGIGHGIAIPHGRLQGLRKVTAVLLTSQPAIDFDAIDNKPVAIFFAILVPADQAEAHLQTLSTIAQKLSDKAQLKSIRAAQNNAELFKAVQ